MDNNVPEHHASLRGSARDQGCQAQHGAPAQYKNSYFLFCFSVWRLLSANLQAGWTLRSAQVKKAFSAAPCSCKNHPQCKSWHHTSDSSGGASYWEALHPPLWAPTQSPKIQSQLYWTTPQIQRVLINPTAYTTLQINSPVASSGQQITCLALPAPRRTTPVTLFDNLHQIYSPIAPAVWAVRRKYSKHKICS